ncbi:transposase [Nostocales cyanobacterium HT-58-2]|nr:transposase [Nostocales cyanobacterium HT-58-2]
MQCPRCKSTHIRKNGKKQGKQNHICVNCGRQFIDVYEPPKGYPDDIKQECLQMYINGMGFRAIERVKGVHHTTVIHWVKQLGENPPDPPEESESSQMGELDQIKTFVGLKVTKPDCGWQSISFT